MKLKELPPPQPAVYPTHSLEVTTAELEFIRYCINAVQVNGGPANANQEREAKAAARRMLAVLGTFSSWKPEEVCLG